MLPAARTPPHPTHPHTPTPFPSSSAALLIGLTSFHLQVNFKRGTWLDHRLGSSSAISGEKELGTEVVDGGGGARGERGNWIFDTCHFHSAAPCSLATHKDFSCHSLACYHEWAHGLRNPITSSVSDSCHYGCYSHVAQIRKDLLIRSFALFSFFSFFLESGLAPPFQSVCLRYELFPRAASPLAVLYIG